MLQQELLTMPTPSQTNHISTRDDQARYDPILWFMIAIIAIMLSGLSIARYHGYNASMFDLGNMTQAIWSATQGEPLVFSYVNGHTSRLALHVEWIYFLFALPYALWPDPRLLLILQAVLFALGALPVYRLAHRRLSSIAAARAFALIYLLYPVAQTSVLFDFHADTIAMPILLFALDALDQQAWRRFALFTLLALASKVYVAIPVALMGIIIWWRTGNRPVAFLTSGIAILYGLVAFFVVRPLFTTEYTTPHHRGLNYLTFYFGQLSEIGATWDDRALHALIVLAPMILLIWRGWYWLVPGLPIAAAVLLSTGPGPPYDYQFHHYALVVPFLFMAAIEGATRHTQQHPEPSPRPRLVSLGYWRSWRGMVTFTLLLVFLTNALLVDTPLNPWFWKAPLGWGLNHAAYGITPRDSMKDDFLEHEVPPDVPLMTSYVLAPHVINRHTIYVMDSGYAYLYLDQDFLAKADYALADALFDSWSRHNNRGGITYQRNAIAHILRNPDWGMIRGRDGLLLFQRHPDPHDVLPQPMPVVLPAPSPHPPLTPFGDHIGLVHAEITPVAPPTQTTGWRLRAHFDWMLIPHNSSDSAPAIPDAIAISRLDGVDHARIVHLPTYLLLPTTEWQPNTIIRETFEVLLPPGLLPGSYPWLVAWYDVHHPESFATDARSRLPKSDELLSTTLELTTSATLEP